MLLDIKWYQFVWNDNVQRLTKQTKLTAYNPVAPAYPIWAYYAHGQQRRCQEDPVSLPSSRLEKTTRSSPHHVAQQRPTGSETTPPYAPRSSRFGSEPPLWRMMSTYGAMQSWGACQKRRRRNSRWLSGTDWVVIVIVTVTVTIRIIIIIQSCPPHVHLVISEMRCWSRWRAILTELSLLQYSAVYHYNGAQRYEQFLQLSWLYLVLILLGLALCLLSASVSLVFMVPKMTYNLSSRMLNLTILFHIYV